MYSQKSKILIVDDTKENIQIVKKVLEIEGYETRTVLDGISALRVVKEEVFDLILLDINMPDMSGISVCRYLKVDPQTASIPVIFLTADDDRETLKKAYDVGGSDYIKKPFYREELIARVSTCINLRNYEKNLEETILQRTREIEETQVALMYALGGIAEGHSKETTAHVQRVSLFTYLLAKLTGMDEDQALLLKDAAALHDIGKLAISSHIVHKKGPLTKSEFKAMKEHASLGAEMLQSSQLPLFKVAKIVAHEHHEKYDGTGYPQGLKGEDIHIYGRIVALADVFDALAFKRSYKEEWTMNEALAYMKDMRGKHFDPVLIDLFFEHIDAFLKIYNVHMQKIVFDQKYSKKKRSVIMDWLLKRF